MYIILARQFEDEEFSAFGEGKRDGSLCKSSTPFSFNTEEEVLEFKEKLPMTLEYGIFMKVEI